jgi:replicative DNA helicase
MSAPPVAPHDLEAERAILGALMVNADLIHDVSEAIAPGDFFRAAHRTLYDAMRGLSERRQPIDFLTVKAALDTKALEECGGPAYLVSLADGVPRSVNVKAYCVIVREAALRRRLQAIATQAIVEAGSADIEAQRAVERAEAAIYELGQKTQTGELCSIDAAIADVWPMIERVVDTGRPEMGTPTGFPDLDQITRGMFPGNLIILAARPGMGKSALALNIAHYAANAGDQTVAFFSLEMSREEITTRLLGAVGRVNMHRLLAGRSRGDDLARIGEARAEAGASSLWIDDTSTQTVTSIRSKARRLKARRGLGLIVVDYLQLLSSERRYDSRVVEVGAMSRGLKQLAGELGVPVLALSQLTRASEGRSESKPRISDLRESGSLEQDANAVWLLHRPEEYQATPENAGLAELIIGKNRKGPTGVVRLRWSGEETRFDSLSDRADS